MLFLRTSHLLSHYCRELLERQDEDGLTCLHYAVLLSLPSLTSEIVRCGVGTCIRTSISSAPLFKFAYSSICLPTFDQTEITVLFLLRLIQHISE